MGNVSEGNVAIKGLDGKDDGSRKLMVNEARPKDDRGGLLASTGDPLRISAQLQAPSGHIIDAVRQLGLEGVVGKRIDSMYEPGERSGALDQAPNE